VPSVGADVPDVDVDAEELSRLSSNGRRRGLPDTSLDPSRHDSPCGCDAPDGCHEEQAVPRWMEAIAANQDDAATM